MGLDNYSYSIWISLSLDIKHEYIINIIIEIPIFKELYTRHSYLLYLLPFILPNTPPPPSVFFVGLPCPEIAYMLQCKLNTVSLKIAFIYLRKISFSLHMTHSRIQTKGIHITGIFDIVLEVIRLLIFKQNPLFYFFLGTWLNYISKLLIVVFMVLNFCQLYICRKGDCNSLHI